MGVDWQELLVPQVSVVELFVRGTAMYLVLLAMLRVLVRRHVGTLSLTDLLVLVLIADAAQNAMASEYRSLPEGVVLCGTIIGWSYVLDWLSFRYRWVSHMLEPSPLPLIRNGRIQRRNMRLELVTMDELNSHLRQHGVEDVHEVKTAHIEPDGQISIITAQDGKSDEAESTERKRGGVL
jgi:uncharacterized membrane protein YcaP (DUF421 family)